MNDKKMKRINLHAKVLLLGWLTSLVSDAEAKKISLAQVQDKLPDQTHYYHLGKIRLSAYSFKWVVKGIKKLCRLDINRSVELIKMSEVQEVMRPRRV